MLRQTGRVWDGHTATDKAKRLACLIVDLCVRRVEEDVAQARRELNEGINGEGADL